MSKQYQKIHPTLPIYTIDTTESRVFYTPGKVHRVDWQTADRIVKAIQQKPIGSPLDQKESELSRTLLDRARLARQNWNSLFTRPFSPECLTVQLANECNLACKYCFSNRQEVRPNQQPTSFNLEALKAAAEVVAESCRRQQRMIYLVITGGGEPTVSWALLLDIFEVVSKVVRESKLELFSYLATNGVMQETQAQWLAEHFSLIGISCDGPPELHNSNRPLKNGKNSSEILKRSVEIIRKHRGKLNFRTTITPHNYSEQELIAKYLTRTLGAELIRFEPVYGADDSGFNSSQVEDYFCYFRKAQNLAEQSGCRLESSGVRINELHSTYCDVLRNTIRLNADGQATNCFFRADLTNSEASEDNLGSYNPEADKFRINDRNIEQLKQQLSVNPIPCRECINEYHCSRGCPDYCQIIVPNAGSSPELNMFRCELHQKLALHQITRLAMIA